jgi:hypothetical protein
MPPEAPPTPTPGLPDLPPPPPTSNALAWLRWTVAVLKASIGRPPGLQPQRRTQTGPLADRAARSPGPMAVPGRRRVGRTPPTDLPRNVNHAVGVTGEQPSPRPRGTGRPG